MELDLAMKEMDEDGSGEVDFAEFAEWWPQQEAKNPALAAAMNDRWCGARWNSTLAVDSAMMKRIDERK